MFNALGQTTTFPLDALLSHISVNRKEGKDPSDCSSYQLISLLNVDLKLFTKLLASRLQSQLSQLVHLDQVGFISSREVRDNTINVLNLVHYANKANTPCVFFEY